MPKLPKRKPIRLPDFDYKQTDYLYYVTICTNKKRNFFLNPELANLVIGEFEHRILLKQIEPLCLCLMPNHLHFVLKLGDEYGMSLQNWVATFKRYTQKQVKDNFGDIKLWQTNFYDHIVRHDESLRNIVEYILENPVRKGFVIEWDEYPYNKLYL